MACIFSTIILLFAILFLLASSICFMCNAFIASIVAICFSVVLFALANHHVKYEKEAINNFILAFNEVNSAFFKGDNVPLEELLEKRSKFVNAFENLETSSFLTKRQKQIYQTFIFLIDLRCVFTDTKN